MKKQLCTIILNVILILAGACTKKIDQSSRQHKEAIDSYTIVPSKYDESSCQMSLTYNNFEAILKEVKFSITNNCVSSFLNSYIELILSTKDLSFKQKSLDLIFEGCDQYTTNGCLYFSKIKSTYGIRQLLLSLAKASKDIGKYYFYLNAWSDIKNESADVELLELYLKRESEYRNLIKKDKDLLEIHDLKISNIAEHANELANNPSFKSFLSSYELVNGKDISKLDEIILKVFFSDKNNKSYSTKIDTMISKEIEALKKIDNLNLADLNYYQKSMDVQIINFDFYYLIVSGSYHNQISPSLLNNIWNYKEGALTQLSEVVKSYLKIKFLQVLSTAHKNIVTFFHSKNYTSNNFFMKAIAKSEEVFPDFQELDQKYEALQIFLKSLYLKGGVEAQNQYENLLRNHFSVIDMNIKYMISYPEMMMLLFEYARKGLEIKIRSLAFGDITRTSNQIMKDFFEGSFNSFFTYSNDQSQISSEEMIYSFYFALHTGLFKDFATNGNEQEMVKEFIKVVTDQISSIELNKLTTDFNDFNNNYKSDATYIAFLNLCNNTPGYTHNLNLEDIRMSVLQGLKLGERLSIKPGFYGPSFERSLERIRINIRNIENLVSSMISIYENYLKKMSTNKEAIEKNVVELNQVIEPLRHLKTSYLTQFMLRHNEIDKCYFNIYKKEKKLQEQLISYEELYLRHLYQQYHNLNSADQESVLNAEIQNYNLRGFKGLNKVKDGKFYYTQIDFLIRTKLYLEKGLQIDNEKHPALTNNIRVSIPTTEYNWNQQQYYNQSQNHAFVLDIKNLSEDEFVQKAFANIIFDVKNNLYGFVTWFIDQSFHTYNFFTFNFKSRSLASLYRLGEFDVYEKEECSLKNTSKGCKKIRKQITVKDLVKIGLELKEFASLSETELEILDKVGRIRRIDDYQLAYSFIHPMNNTAENWGIFDYLYYSLKEPLLDDHAKFPWLMEDDHVTPGMDKRKGIFQSTNDYCKARNQRGNFIFTIDNEIESKLVDNYKNLALNEIAKIKEFEKAVLSGDNEQINALKAPIHYEINKVVEKDILSESLIEESDAVIENFQQQTNTCWK